MDIQNREKLKYCEDSQHWPKKWMIVDEDLDYGEKIVEEFKPFILFLINKKYTKKTIVKHCDNLWLLGGEIISSLNRDESLRKVSPKKILAESVNEFGGPYSNHLDSETAQNSFDSTCKKLHKFLTSDK